jgi:citrate lyase synthetase
MHLCPCVESEYLRVVKSDMDVDIKIFSNYLYDILFLVKNYVATVGFLLVTSEIISVVAICIRQNCQ